MNPLVVFILSLNEASPLLYCPTHCVINLHYMMVTTAYSGNGSANASASSSLHVNRENGANGHQPTGDPPGLFSLILPPSHQFPFF